MSQGSLPRARSPWRGSTRTALFALSFLAVTVCIVAAFHMAVARQPAPPDIGESFAIFTGPGVQRGPVIAFDDGARRHLIVWSDTTAGDVFGRLVGDGGRPIGSHFPISLAAGAQISPTVAAGLPGQGFLVVWQDARGEDWDVYGQRVSAGGRLLNADGEPDADPTTNTPLITGAGDQHMPDLAYSATSDLYLLVSVSTGSDSSTEVVGRQVSPTGVPLGELITVATDPQAVAHPAVAHNALADEFLIVWQRQDVWLENRRLSATGDLQGPRQRIWGSLPQPYPAPIPDVVYNPVTGEYLLVWDNAVDENVYGVRVAADGQAVSEPVTISSAAGLQVRPHVGVHDTGYLAVWRDRRTPGASDLYGQLLSNSGELVDPGGTPEPSADANIPLATGVPGAEGPVLAFNAGGVEYLLSWAELRQAGLDILAQRLWFPAMGPRPTPTPTSTPTVTATPTLAPTPRPMRPLYLVLILRNWPVE